MKRASSVEEYIEFHEKFSKALETLRRLMLETEMTETLKWGIPTYTVNGKNVCGIGAFKNHFGIWFFNGVFLKDEHRLLRNAQKGKTRAMRQMIFESEREIKEDLVKLYIREAIDNQKAGLVVKPRPTKKSVDIPEELKTTFQSNPVAAKEFNRLAPYKQREYSEYISSAKREATRKSRLEKIIPMIENGIGLNDKYKNC